MKPFAFVFPRAIQTCVCSDTHQQGDSGKCHFTPKKASLLLPVVRSRDGLFLTWREVNSTAATATSPPPLVRLSLPSCSYLTRGVEWVIRCLDRLASQQRRCARYFMQMAGTCFSPYLSRSTSSLCHRSPFFCLPSLCRISVFSGLFALPGGKTCLNYVCEGAPHYSTTSHS